MEIALEPVLNQNELIQMIHLYDENFSPHVRIPHRKLKKTN